MKHIRTRTKEQHMDITPEQQKQIDDILNGAAAQPTTTFAEPQAPSATLDDMIAAARSNLQLAPAKPTAGKLEAPDPHLVNTLLAQADEFKRVVDAATKEREKIKAFLGDLIEASESEPGQIEELTVNGATVFTYKTVTSRVLDQVHLKSVFPDIAENAECWKDQVSRRKEFK